MEDHLPEIVEEKERREATEQRKSEALAAYAGMRPTTHFMDFLRENNLARSTWMKWSHDPVFKSKLDAIKQVRASIDFEPFWRALGQTNDALAKKCVVGDVPAVRTMYELLGFLKPQSIKVTNVVDTSQSTINVQSSDEELEDLIGRAARTRDLIARRAARADVSEGDPEPSGPGHNGGAPA